jgi:FHS family L-fucose permease-like MFS transporter
LRHKNVRWAVVAQFFYVGAQVCILSFLVLYATEAAGISGKDGADYAGFAGLAFMLGRFIGTFFMRFVSASKLLIIYSAIAIVLSLFVIFGSGIQTLYALIGIAFFMSIMFPTIFAFGVQGIGADTKSASSLIVMSIVGGALLPPILGLSLIKRDISNMAILYHWFVLLLSYCLLSKIEMSVLRKRKILNHIN